MPVVPAATGNLQAVLAAASATTTVPTYSTRRAPNPPPDHHPIQCPSDLKLFEDNRLACDHGEVPGDDERTQTCINHSVSLLVIALAVEWPPTS